MKGMSVRATKIQSEQLKIMDLLNQENKKHYSLRKFSFLLLFILTIGICLRFINLDQKVYSADEVRKILLLSGYTRQEFINKAFTGNIITAEEIKKYQIPNSERSLNDVVKALTSKAQYVPLHNLITRFWMQLFGSHPSARNVSIFLSFLSFPCFYWLCLELFKSPLTGWVAIALAAISPFHILTAQNVSAYSLWTVITLASSAILLTALRVKTKSSWLMYAATIALGLYTHLFSAIVILGHGIYVLLIERCKFTKNLAAYLIASIIGLLGFIPWIYVFLNKLDAYDKAASYYRQFKITFSQLIIALYSNIGKVFVDFYHQKGKTESLLHLGIFILIVYSLYFLILHTNKNVWLFIIILISLTPIVHILANFNTPSALHIQSRYYLPSFLGIELSVAYLLACQISLISRRFELRRIWQLIFLAILALGMISGLILAHARDAALDDQKGTASGQNLEVAPLINQSQHPLVISETTHSFVLALSYLVKDDVQFMLLKDRDIEQWEKKLNLAEITNKFSDCFLYFPDEEFRNFISQKNDFKVEPVTKGLDKIVKTSS